MKFTIDGTTFRIDFRRVVIPHELPKHKNDKTGFRPMSNNITTIAELYVKVGDEFVRRENIFGSATCYYKDKFDKETGRKEALEKLLKNMTLTKHQRQYVWWAYFCRDNDLGVLYDYNPKVDWSIETFFYEETL